MFVFKLIVFLLLSLFLLYFANISTSATQIYAAEPELAPEPAPEDRDEDPWRLSPAPSPSPSPEEVFDVTDYGAVADGVTDSSSAFLAAWQDACSCDGNAKVYVPEGTFYVGPVTFEGPCFNNQQAPEFNIRGILKAPSSLDAFPSSTWIVFKRLEGFKLRGEAGITTLDGQGEAAWALGSSDKHFKSPHRPTSLKFVNISRGTINNIALLNSKNFHMSFLRCRDIFATGIKISSPWNSPNTDGIHISCSSNINITSSTLGVGDDCVSIGPGSTNISVLNVTCGPGHGISVGSLGKYKDEENVTGIVVKNCTINGTQNGVRVKTWPGSPPSTASNLTFEDIVMINVSNPIIIDQEYCPNRCCITSQPSRVKLSNIYFRNIKGTFRSKFGVTLVCSSSVPCENIHVLDVKLNHTTTTEDNLSDQSSSKLKGAFQGVEFII